MARRSRGGFPAGLVSRQSPPAAGHARPPPTRFERRRTRCHRGTMRSGPSGRVISSGTAPLVMPMPDACWRRWARRNSPASSIRIYGRPDRVYKTQGISAVDGAEFFLQVTDNLLGDPKFPATPADIPAEDVRRVAENRSRRFLQTRPGGRDPRPGHVVQGAGRGDPDPGARGRDVLAPRQGSVAASRGLRAYRHPVERQEAGEPAVHGAGCATNHPHPGGHRRAGRVDHQFNRHFKTAQGGPARDRRQDGPRWRRLHRSVPVLPRSRTIRRRSPFDPPSGFSAAAT